MDLMTTQKQVSYERNPSVERHLRTLATGFRESGVSGVGLPGLSCFLMVWSKIITRVAPVTFLTRLFPFWIEWGQLKELD